MKFSIKKIINLNKKNNKTKFTHNSLVRNTKSPLQKDSKERIEENVKGTRKTKNNNYTEINSAESFGNSSDLKTNKELQMHDNTEVEEEFTCNNCKVKLEDEWKRPHWKWNFDMNIKFCVKCYGMKEIEYEKLMNHCIACNSKLKFIRYNPKPEWKLKGQLCRKCWDYQNDKYKRDR